jgi:hypothetical protein
MSLKPLETTMTGSFLVMVEDSIKVEAEKNAESTN